MKNLFLSIVITVFSAGAFAGGFTGGLHLGSVHEWKSTNTLDSNASTFNNTNPGVYVKHNDTGLVGGVYYNSIRRASVYVGWVYENGPFSLTVGAISGYKKKVYKSNLCSATEIHTFNNAGINVGVGSTCWYYIGNYKRNLGALVSPSIKAPFQILGVTPRLSLLPRIGGNPSVLHLSVERQF